MSIDSMTTDQVFEKLPAMIQSNGDIYFIGIIKGNNRVIVEYVTSDSKRLEDTRRSGDTLNLALKSMLKWLIQFSHFPIREDNIPELNETDEDTIIG